MRTQDGKDIPIYDRTASRLRSDLFWGLKRQANTVGGGAIRQDPPPNGRSKSKQDPAKADAILNVVGVQSFPVTSTDLFAGVDASRINLDEVALGKML